MKADEINSATYPLTPSQNAFWALHEVFPGSAAGNEAVLLRLRGELNVEALERSLAELARCHDSWRTSVQLDIDSPSRVPLARVNGCATIPLETVAVPGRSEEERKRLLGELVQERLHARFDLSRGPLVRAALLRSGPRESALLLVSNHIVSDGVSLFEVFPRQLAACYAAFSAGGTSPLPPIPSFASFARRQEVARTDASDQALEFWRRNLAGVQGAIDLPYDHRRSGARSGRGLRRTTWIAPERRARLAERAREMQVTVSDLLLAAFVALLQRYSGESSFLIGVPHKNRDSAAEDELFGCAMTTVPLRLEIEGNPTFRDLAQQVRAQKRTAFSWRDARAELLLRSALPAADRASGPGYRVVFGYMLAADRPRTAAGLGLSIEQPDPGWAAVDLSLDVRDEGDRLALTIEIDRDVFDLETAERCQGHLSNLLAGVEQSVTQRVSELPFLGALERETVTRTFNATALPFPRERTLHEVVLEHAQEHHGALAIASGTRVLTYGALVADVHSLAAHLRAAGARPGERVALILDDPIAVVTGMLGILASGAAYVPVDPKRPRARTERKLAAAQPAVIVTRSALLSELPEHAGAVTLCLDALPAATPPMGGVDPGPEDPAYVIFTSGSTGEPKGVVVRHRNVVHQLCARLHGYGDRPERLLTAHALAFDAAVAGVYWTLASGGLLVLPEGEERRDAAVLRQLIDRHGITHLDLPPLLHQELLAGALPGEMRSLTTVIVGGEVCKSELARHHAQRLPGVRLYNEYGPTETTVYSTVHEVDLAHPADPVPIGRPIANTRCYVLDPRGEPVPVGVVGELYIGGEGVAAGYLDNPALTESSFLPDPFADEYGARMYRTGDLARWRRDGELEYLGRRDRQLKIRGFRVEPSEIEAALQRIPGVLHAVAVPRQEPTGACVDAYVVGTGPRELSPRTVRRLLRAHLPEHMLPAHLTVIDELPLNATGKVDLERLPSPTEQDLAAAETEPGHVDARTQTEERIAALWAELLGLSRVGMFDDFFDLGGQSLLAVRMLSLLRTMRGVRIPLSAFLKSPTVSHLAQLMHAEGEAEESLVLAVQTGGDNVPFWLIHPVGGHIVFARRLAAHLGPDQPLYGIQAQGLDGRRPPLESIEEMARLYMTLIRSVQASGPYCVGGHSMGGVFAFEIARQLHASGQSLGLVALFDTYGPGYPRRLQLLPRVLDHARFHLKALTRERTSPKVVNGAAALAAGEVEIDDAIDRVARANVLAQARYVFRPYPGPIHLFHATRTPDWPGMRFDDPFNGFADLAAHVHVLPIDSTHQVMMDEPALTEVGSKLSALLTGLRATERR